MEHLLIYSTKLASSMRGSLSVHGAHSAINIQVAQLGRASSHFLTVLMGESLINKQVFVGCTRFKIFFPGTLQDSFSLYKGRFIIML